MLTQRFTCMCAAQETGRAGRDGKSAVCILYYSYGDAVRMRHMLKQSAEEQATSPAQLACNMDSLNHMVPPPAAPMPCVLPAAVPDRAFEQEMSTS